MINVHKPANDAEALALESVLKEHDIDCDVVSFHDTAYDGLYQSQYGWGIIKVREEDYEEAQKIIAEWKSSAPADLPWDKAKENGSPS